MKNTTKPNETPLNITKPDVIWPGRQPEPAEIEPNQEEAETGALVIEFVWNFSGSHDVQLRLPDPVVYHDYRDLLSFPKK